MQLDGDRPQPAQHGPTYPARGDHTDVHPLQVIGALDTVRDVPATVGGPAVRRHEVANQGQDLHDGVLGDADAVAVGRLGTGDVPLLRRVEVHVIRANAGGQ